MGRLGGQKHSVRGRVNISLSVRELNCRIALEHRVGQPSTRASTGILPVSVTRLRAAPRYSQHSQPGGRVNSAVRCLGNARPGTARRASIPSSVSSGDRQLHSRTRSYSSLSTGRRPGVGA